MSGLPLEGPGRALPPRRPVAVGAVAGSDDATPDLVAVQDDDALLDALARGVSVPAGGGGHDPDDRFVAMLAAWKAEVDAEPIPELVDVDTAMAAIRAGTEAATDRSRRSRRRHLVPLVGAAALIVFAVAGVSLGAHGAQPGDTLFGVTEVLYQETAQSRQAAVDAQVSIEKVGDALAAGDTAAAAAQLSEVGQLMAKVKPEDGAPELAANQMFLAAKLQETPAGTPVDPNAPLRDGTPRPRPPAIEGTPSTPTEPTSTLPPADTSAPVTSEPTTPTSEPPASVEPPPVTSTPPSTTGPTTTAQATSEGGADSTPPGLGSPGSADGSTAPVT